MRIIEKLIYAVFYPILAAGVALYRIYYSQHCQG